MTVHFKGIIISPRRMPKIRSGITENSRTRRDLGTIYIVILSCFAKLHECTAKAISQELVSEWQEAVDFDILS
jgi:hypothetical protein